MSDYIPRSDSDFDNWQTIFIEYVDENKVAWEIPESKVTELKSQATIWASKYTKTVNRQNRTSAEIRAKDDARETFEDLLRKTIAQYISFNDKIEDSDREFMGLTIRKGKHSPVPVPTSSPILTIDFSVRLQHTLTIVDDSTPFRRSKPAGVLGCEIWAKIDGEPPTQASELIYLSMATRSTHIVVFDGSKTGKKVYYWVRWINRRQQAGPWSAMYSAIVG